MTTAEQSPTALQEPTAPTPASPEDQSSLSKDDRKNKLGFCLSSLTTKKLFLVT